jgi:uncharacterized phage protein (TIGR02218 family)
VRSASAGLISLLAGNTQFLVADLLTIVQANGTITRLTSADFDVTAVSKYDSASHSFSSSGPKFTRGRVKLTRGIVVDEMPISILPDPAQLLGSFPWPQAAAAGALDGARVMLERAFMASWGDTSVGTVILFSGRVSQINPSRYEIQLSVKSDLEILDTLIPRNTLQPTCIHTLYDSGCTLLKSAFQVAAVVTAGSTAAAVLASALSQATGYFDLGTITFTSGVLNGATRAVKTYTNSASVKTIVPAVPFSPVGSSTPTAPANGDTFAMYPGCDKLQATCSSKFSNLGRFRGYPYIPPPENAK